jgi:hypothetical protein
LRQHAADAGRRAKAATSADERKLLEEIQTRLNNLAEIEDRRGRPGKKDA